MNATRTLSVAGFAACLAIPAGAYEGRGPFSPRAKAAPWRRHASAARKFSHEAIGGKR